MKKFDLEFSVDPLFKKTCADFDEGGASGLLLNHLQIYGNGRIVFDASDVDTCLNSKQQQQQQQETEEDNEPVDIKSLLGKSYDDTSKSRHTST